MSVTNIKNKASKITEYYSPQVIGEVNDTYIKLARIKGQEVPWHNHKGEDELFLIIEGELLFEIENQKSFPLKKGDMYIVPKGVDHRISSKSDCVIMLVEPKSTTHLGDTESAITKSIEEQLNN